MHQEYATHEEDKKGTKKVEQSHFNSLDGKRITYAKNLQNQKSTHSNIVKGLMSSLTLQHREAYKYDTMNV